MEEIKVKGLVIHTSDYKEKDKLITLFTLELGKIVASLKGVKQPKAKLKFASQKFCFGEFVLIKRGEFFTVKSVDLIESFYDLTKDYDRYMVAESILEMIGIIMQPVQINEEYFILNIKALSELCYNDKLNENILLIKYMLSLFLLHGYELSFNACSECATKFIGDIYFDYDIGNILCKNCSGLHSVLLHKQDYNMLKLINATSIDKLHTIKNNNYSYAPLLKILLKNFSVHFNRSIKTLKEYIL